MTRVLVVVAALVGTLALPSTAAAALEVRLSVKPAAPVFGQRGTVELRTYIPYRRANGTCCRLEPGGPTRYPFRVEAVTPDGDVERVAVQRRRGNLWTGTVVFDVVGRWELRVANYGPSYRHAPGARPRMFVRIATPPPPPPPFGFGSLGAPGCAPPSPRNQSAVPFEDAEVVGTSKGARFWGLFAFNPPGSSWGSREAAIFDGVVGKGIKIVFKFTIGFPSVFFAESGATRLEPMSSTQHLSSTWRRVGWEWGTVWVFPHAGCWRIHAETGTASGDIWLVLRS